MKNIKTRFVKTIALAMSAVLLCGSFALVGCSSNNAGTSGSSSAKSSAATSAAATSASSEATMTGIHHVQMTVEGYDPITIELDADAAPITVTNFVNLVNDGFYNGLTFYRFEQGFCMQGGSAGNSASSTNDGLTPIVGEFSSNGYNNPLADDFHEGVVAMARTSVKDSATSTFFVTLGPASSVGPALDGDYAAFGIIDADGMAIVNQIVADYLPYATANMGMITDEAHQAKIESITVID